MRQRTARTKITNTISSVEASTLPGLLKCRIERTPSLPAYTQYDHKKRKWITWYWQEIGDQVARWQNGLLTEALNPGDRVAILLANSVEWVCFEQAALALGMVVVPLYVWDSPENIAFLLKDSGCKLLLTNKREQWHALIPYTATFPELEKVLCQEGKLSRQTSGIKTVSIAEWLPDNDSEIPPHTIAPDDLATIVYTSGTTGPPKGVMLSHKNILWNSEAILKVVPSYTSDILLSFLPLSHTFERTAGYYTPMMAGSSVAYSRSMKDLPEDLKIIRPTIIISVPRIFEKVYAKIQNKIQQENYFTRWLFALTLNTGWHRFEWSQGRIAFSALKDRLLWSVLHRMVAAKVLDQLGGRIRLAVSGGAPLQNTVSRFFLSLGLPLIQGYGLTEAAPVISTNSLDDNIPTSVGPPLPGLQYRIGQDDELLVKSPGLMSGYWNLPEKSKESIDQEGWLHTGDVIKVENNHIHILGRLKEIIVTSTGEKIAPGDLESAMTNDPLIDQAMVIGEGMPYLAALIVLNQGQWQELATRHGLDPKDHSSLHAPAAEQAVIDKIHDLLHGFPAYAGIRSVGLLLEDWTIANGLLTPTMKLKRKAIEDRYSDTIQELYKGHELPV